MAIGGMIGMSEAASGGRVSGAGADPCPDPGREKLRPAEKFAARQVPPDREPVGELQRYGRMLRPFPTRRLADALYHVEAEGAALTRVLQNLLVEPPQTAEPWSEALYYVLDCLDGICERAMEARPQIERMIDTADVDAERAAAAMRAIVSVLAPPCPKCGGHGGDVASGNCDACQGTAIDPRAPLSPL
jgi:hypothetical protein